MNSDNDVRQKSGSTHRMTKFKGTGRANFTGGGATITVPKAAAVELFELDSDGADVAFFEEDGKLLIANAEDVTYDS